MLRKLYMSISTPECALALFLLSTAVGGDLPDLGGISLPLALFTVSIFLTGRAWSSARWRWFRPPATILLGWLGFLFVASVGLTFSLSPAYGAYKLAVFAGLTSWAYFGAMFSARDPASLKRLFYILLSGSILLSGLALTSYFATYQTYQLEGWLNPLRANALGGNPITLGRIAGTGLLLLASLYGSRASQLRTPVLVLCAGVAALALISSGSRTPLIALLPLLPWAFVGSRGRGYRRVTNILVGLALAVVVGFLAFRIESLGPSLARLGSIALDAGTGAERLHRFRIAWEMFLQAPLAGMGFGSFAGYFGGEFREYPHNMVLEVLCETGLVGITSFGLFVGLSGRNLVQRRGSRHLRTGPSGAHVVSARSGGHAPDPPSIARSPDHRFLLTATQTCAVYWALNVLSTGDLNDNRIFFAFLGIAAARPWNSGRSKASCVESPPRRHSSVATFRRSTGPHRLATAPRTRFAAEGPPPRALIPGLDGPSPGRVN